MVVADAILEARRRSRRLNAADEPFRDQHRQAVVDRLQRDRSDLLPDRFGHRISRDVGIARDGAKDRQSLRCYLNAAFSQEMSRVAGHIESISNTGVTLIFDTLAYLC